MDKHIIDNVEFSVGDEVRAEHSPDCVYYFTIGKIEKSDLKNEVVFIADRAYVYMYKNAAGKRFPSIQMGSGMFGTSDHKITMMKRW